MTDETKDDAARAADRAVDDLIRWTMRRTDPQVLLASLPLDDLTDPTGQKRAAAQAVELYRQLSAVGAERDAALAELVLAEARNRHEAGAMVGPDDRERCKERASRG